VRLLSRESRRRLLSTPDGPKVGLLIAPNYEPRSVLGAREVLQNLAQRVRAHVWTLQAKRLRVEPLESLKQENRREVLALLGVSQVGVEEVDVDYPEAFSGDFVKGHLDSIAGEIGADGVLVVDISTMPRRLITAILQWWVMSQDWHGRLVLLYAWAGGYCRRPSEEGDLKLLEQDARLADVLARHKPIMGHCVLICGRQGFDARQLLDGLPSAREATAYILLERENLHTSLEVVRANVQTLASGAAGRIPIHYCLSVESGHRRILQWANGVTIARNHAYILAPFGPKPFAVSAFLAIHRLQVRARAEIAGPLPVAGTVSLSGHQYNSPYSLGFHKVDAFEMTRDGA
jgi:hypothetical protein